LAENSPGARRAHERLPETEEVRADRIDVSPQDRLREAEVVVVEHALGVAPELRHELREKFKVLRPDVDSDQSVPPPTVWGPAPLKPFVGRYFP